MYSISRCVVFYFGFCFCVPLHPSLISVSKYEKGVSRDTCIGRDLVMCAFLFPSEKSHVCVVADCHAADTATNKRYRTGFFNSILLYQVAVVNGALSAFCRRRVLLHAKCYIVFPPHMF